MCYLTVSNMLEMMKNTHIICIYFIESCLKPIICISITKLCFRLNVLLFNRGGGRSRIRIVVDANELRDKYKKAPVVVETPTDANDVLMPFLVKLINTNEPKLDFFNNFVLKVEYDENSYTSYFGK